MHGVRRVAAEEGNDVSEDTEKELKRAEDAFAWAKRKWDDFALEVRARLQGGYDPRGCMWEVSREVRYQTTKGQCQKPANPGPGFDDIVCFCSTHAGNVSGLLRYREESEVAVHRARTIHRTVEAEEARRAQTDYGVYLMHDKEHGRVKIGMTGNLKARANGLRAGAPSALVLLEWLPSAHSHALERHLHDHFATIRIKPRGEWFTVGDALAFTEEAKRVAAEFEASE